MSEHGGHSERDTEQPKFSGAKLDLDTIGAEVGHEEVEDRTETAVESVPDIEDPMTAKLLAELHPTWPPIELRIHFSGHGTPEDFRGVPETLQDPDPATRPAIYLYESIGGSLEISDFWQDIADDKDWSVEEALKANPEFVGIADEAIMRGLLGSEVAVGSIDLREANEEEAALATAIDQSFDLSLYDFFTNENFEECLQEVDRMAVSVARQEQIREPIIAQHLEPEIARLIEERPELGTKDKLNIFITLGSYHTTLFRDLEQAGFAINRTSSEKPFFYSYAGELYRVHQFEAEARLNVKRKNELLARAYLELVFVDEGPDAKAYDDTVLVERYIGEQFDYDEIKVMHGELMQGHKPPTEILGEHLKAKGFDDLPKDPAEVHELAVWLRAGLQRKAGLKKEESSSDDAKEVSE